MSALEELHNSSFSAVTLSGYEVEDCAKLLIGVILPRRQQPFVLVVCVAMHITIKVGNLIPTLTQGLTQTLPRCTATF